MRVKGALIMQMTRLFGFYADALTYRDDAVGGAQATITTSRSMVDITPDEVHGVLSIGAPFNTDVPLQSCDSPQYSDKKFLNLFALMKVTHFTPHGGVARLDAAPEAGCSEFSRRTTLRINGETHIMVTTSGVNDVYKTYLWCGNIDNTMNRCARFVFGEVEGVQPDEATDMHERAVAHIAEQVTGVAAAQGMICAACGNPTLGDTLPYVCFTCDCERWRKRDELEHAELVWQLELMEMEDAELIEEE